MGRIGTPSDVVGAVVYWPPAGRPVTGHVLDVDAAGRPGDRRRAQPGPPRPAARSRSCGDRARHFARRCRSPGACSRHGREVILRSSRPGSRIHCGLGASRYEAAPSLAGAGAEQEVLTLNLREQRGRSSCSNSSTSRTSSRELPAGRSSGGTSATTGSRRRTRASSSPASRLRQTGLCERGLRIRGERWAGSLTSTASRRGASAHRDSLSTRSPRLFAVQGILAASTTVTCSATARQVVDVSLMEASFALLESASSRPPRPRRHRRYETQESRVEHSQVRDDSWMVIARTHDNLFRRLCEAMGGPNSADDPRFATQRARQRTGEIEGIVAGWAAWHDAREIDRVLKTRRVVCGRIYTMSEILRGSAVQGGDMLVETSPEFGPSRPGIVPKLSRRRARCGWSARGGGRHNEEIYCGLLD